MTTSPSSDQSNRPTDGPTPAELRSWARNRGLEVGARGRISAEIRQQHEADSSR